MSSPAAPGNHSHSHGHSHGSPDAAAAPVRTRSGAASTTLRAHSHASTGRTGESAVHRRQAARSMAGLLNLVADASHNFTDGLAIAASFMASPQVRAVRSLVSARPDPPLRHGAAACSDGA